MFLTKFDMNKARRGTQKLLGSPQAMHAAVLSSFPPNELPSSRVLWRVDEWPNRTNLYIVSSDLPDLTHLIEQAGWPSLKTWQTRDYSSALNQINEGQRYSFRLTANPTHTVKFSEQGRSKRIGHVTMRHQWAWLLGKAPGIGINIGSKDEPSGIIVAKGTRRFTRKNNKVTLNTATFQGELVVTDVKLLRQALVNGIGPAKAYGCGLLTLSLPHQSNER